MVCERAGCSHAAAPALVKMWKISQVYLHTESRTHGTRCFDKVNMFLSRKDAHFNRTFCTDLLNYLFGARKPVSSYKDTGSQGAKIKKLFIVFSCFYATKTVALPGFMCLLAKYLMNCYKC